MPIKLGQGLGKIFQPKLIDFINNDTSIEELAQIFCVRLDIIDVSQEDIQKLMTVLKDFDLFFLDEDKTSLNKLVHYLKFLYKTDNVYLSVDKQCILIDDDIILNRNNYTYLADVVLNMLCMEKPKKQENKRKYKDDYRQKLWEKMQRYRAENEKKNAITFLDIVNFVVHSNSVIDYERVYNLTYYQLVNTYTTLMNKLTYEEHMMYKTSGQFKMDGETKHWGIQSKIKKGIDL